VPITHGSTGDDPAASSMANERRTRSAQRYSFTAVNASVRLCDLPPLLDFGVHDNLGHIRIASTRQVQTYFSRSCRAIGARAMRVFASITESTITTVTARASACAGPSTTARRDAT